MWLLFFIETRASILDSGLITESDFEEMMTRLMIIVENEDDLILPMCNYQVAGRSPNGLVLRGDEPPRQEQLSVQPPLRKSFREQVR